MSIPPATTMLALNGWAQPADGLAPLFPQAAHFPYSDSPDLPTLWARLRAAAPDVLLGWSLGGQLAARAVTEGILRPRALILIAAPWRFVASHAYPQGMGATTFELFVRNYRRDPLRTARRFAHLIAQGDSRAAEIELSIAPLLPVMAEGMRWLRWLEYLDEWQPEPAQLQTFPPTLIFHGEADGIVAAAQAELWARHLPDATLELWPACGHAPHLHDVSRLQRRISEWRTSRGL